MDFEPTAIGRKSMSKRGRRNPSLTNITGAPTHIPKDRESQPSTGQTQCGRLVSWMLGGVSGGVKSPRSFFGSHGSVVWTNSPDWKDIRHALRAFGVLGDWTEPEGNSAVGVGVEGDNGVSGGVVGGVSVFASWILDNEGITMVGLDRTMAIGETWKVLTTCSMTLHGRRGLREASTHLGCTSPPDDEKKRLPSSGVQYVATDLEGQKPRSCKVVLTVVPRCPLQTVSTVEYLFQWCNGVWSSGIMEVSEIINLELERHAIKRKITEKLNSLDLDVLALPHWDAVKKVPDNPITRFKIGTSITSMMMSNLMNN
ncbi:hypothetical protein L218DRAFT_989249 [Marasmius fiardii PR-910]|nr:hypothetical protein L218DRAFT_989249 [Marasmius fiardii PR-910]